MAVAWWYRKTLTKLQNPIALDDSAQTEAGRSEEAAFFPDKDFRE
jgi:hypothetical protein